MQKAVLVVLAVAAVCAVGGVAAFMLTQSESYAIEYELDGGEFVSDHPESYRPGKDIDVPSPVKDGYLSAGFYTDPGLTRYFDGSTDGMEGVLTLYARWIESPIGQFVTYSQEGECDRGFSSYTLTGTRMSVFYHYSIPTGTMYTQVFGNDDYYYPEVGTTYSEFVMELQSSPGFSGYEYRGTETIETATGARACDKYTTAYDNGAVGTIWIDGCLIYKECYDYVGTGDSEVRSEHITLTLQSAVPIELPTGGTLSLFTGDGISVSGYKDRYDLGEAVSLTAEVEKGKTFGGWYDSDLNLLSADRTYSFEYIASTSVYAMNSQEGMVRFDKGVEVDLDGAFGLDGATYSLYNLDAGTFVMTESPYTFAQSGMYKITTNLMDDGNHVYWAEVAGDVTREYTWEWDGDDYSVKMDIDYDDYLYAKDYYGFGERRQDKPTHERDKTFVELSYQDKRMSRYVEKMASLLVDAYKEKNPKVTEEDYLNYLLAFVQYIPYQTDEEYLGYAEYWKFPLETLFDYGGDCEDTAILYAAIAHESMGRLGFDCDAALQILPGHMAVAIRTDAVKAKANPMGYVYGETTAKGYAVGRIPDKVSESFLDSDYYPTKSFTVIIDRMLNKRFRGPRGSRNLQRPIQHHYKVRRVSLLL